MAVDTSPQAAYISASAHNQATDYTRYQQELARQKAAYDAQQKKMNSFGYKLRSVGGQLLGVAGAAAGGALGGPVGGMVGGGLGSALGGLVSPTGAPGNNSASLAAMGGQLGSYLNRPGGMGSSGNSISSAATTQYGDPTNQWGSDTQFLGEM